MARKTGEWKRHKTIDHALDVVGIDRYDLAARLSVVTKTEWSYQMVAKLCTGRKRFDADIVWAVSKATGLPYEWFLDDPRDMLNEAKGAYLPADRDSRTYLIPDDHPINDQVAADWHTRDTVDLREPLQKETLPIAVGL